MSQVELKKTAELLFARCPEGKKLFLAGKNEEAHEVLMASINESNRVKWTSETFRDRLDRIIDEPAGKGLNGKELGKNGFRLINLVFTGDKLVITSTPNVISSSLSINYSNEKLNGKNGTVQRFSLNNCKEAWDLLKKCNEMHGVKVLYQAWDLNAGNPIERSVEVPFEESTPYSYRFGRLASKVN